MPTAPADRTPVNAHFLDLVRQGRRHGCSVSEREIRELAIAIHEVVPSLDGQAIQGLHQWIDFVKEYPSTAVHILR